jgi:hypothetical protein
LQVSFRGLYHPLWGLTNAVSVPTREVAEVAITAIEGFILAFTRLEDSIAGPLGLWASTGAASEALAIFITPVAYSLEFLPGEGSDHHHRSRLPPIPKLSSKCYLASYDESSEIGSALPCSSAPS